MLVYSVQQPALPPLTMPDRFRTDVAYFMTPPEEPGVPELGQGEYWIRAADARTWLDECVVIVVSPLSAEAKAEIELSEEHETFLEWLLSNEIEHVRLQR